MLTSLERTNKLEASLFSCQFLKAFNMTSWDSDCVVDFWFCVHRVLSRQISSFSFCMQNTEGEKWTVSIFDSDLSHTQIGFTLVCGTYIDFIAPSLQFYLAVGQFVAIE